MASVTTQEREYNPEVLGRARSSAPSSSRRLRLAYFGAASAWGFAVGVFALLIGLDVAGAAVSLEVGSFLALIPAAGVAAGGALVIAGAYQEAKRRRR